MDGGLSAVVRGSGGIAGGRRRHRGVGDDLAEMFAFFDEVTEARRRDPGDDLISMIVEATPDGETLTSPEVVMFCILLLVAGNETTTNLLGSLQMGLWHHPDQLASSRQRPELAAAAVEEGLRFGGPVKACFAGRRSPASSAVSSFPRARTCSCCSRQRTAMSACSTSRMRSTWNVAAANISPSGTGSTLASGRSSPGSRPGRARIASRTRNRPRACRRVRGDPQPDPSRLPLHARRAVIHVGWPPLRRLSPDRRL